MSQKILIDTRFFVEYLFSSDENTKEKVIKLMNILIRKKNGLVPSIVIADLSSIICRYLGVVDAKSIVYSLIFNNFSIVEVNSDDALVAGILKCKHKNVPIGDCLIAAIAKRLNASVLTDDLHFKEELGVKTLWL